MRKNIQVRRYASLAQVDQDLRLIEPTISRIEKACAKIEEGDGLSPDKMRKYVACVEHSANIHRVMANVRLWIDHASVKEGPKNVEAKMNDLNKRLAGVNTRLRKSGDKTYKPSKKLRATAGQIKLFSDALLVNNFETAKSAVLVLVDRDTHDAFPVIQTAYCNVCDDSNFRYPELFINVAEVDGSFEIGLSRTNSLFKSGRFNRFVDVEIAKVYIQNMLGGMNVVRKRGK